MSPRCHKLPSTYPLLFGQTELIVIHPSSKSGIVFSHVARSHGLDSEATTSPISSENIPKGSGL